MGIAFVLVLGVSLNAEATFWKKDKTEAEKQTFKLYHPNMVTVSI